MKLIKNPCRKCLVKACCLYECEKYSSFNSKSDKLFSFWILCIIISIGVTFLVFSFVFLYFALGLWIISGMLSYITINKHLKSPDDAHLDYWELYVFAPFAFWFNLFVLFGAWYLESAPDRNNERA